MESGKGVTACCYGGFGEEGEVVFKGLFRLLSLALFLEP